MRVLLPDLRRVSAALVFALSSAVHTAHSQTLQKLATYQGEDRQQRLVEGARKEGSLLFYATFPVEYADQLIEPFRISTESRSSTGAPARKSSCGRSSPRHAPAAPAPT